MEQRALQVGGRLQGHWPLPGRARRADNYHPWRTEELEGFHSTPSPSKCEHLPKRTEGSRSPRRAQSQQDAREDPGLSCVWWRQSWGCASGHRGPAAASCVPRGALQPSLRASTTLAAIAQSTGRERQGQLSWVTAKTEKERGKKVWSVPGSSSQHGRPGSCPCTSEETAWGKGRLWVSFLA